MSLDIIREATQEELCDEGWLAQTILDLGISDSPTYESYKQHGYGVWQTPEEMASHLLALAMLGIRTYAEIGMWYGGGFIVTVEYLSRFGLERALGLDIDVKPSVREYANNGAAVPIKLVETPSASPTAKKALKAAKPDLVFIDGDHSFEAVQKDWEHASRCGARYVSFHDLSQPGVAEVWDAIHLPKIKWLLGPGTGLVKVK